MHIILSYLDFEDCADRVSAGMFLESNISTDLSPKSNIMCFEIQQGNGSPTESNKPVTWVS
jgi:hypothetical protein